LGSSHRLEINKTIETTLKSEPGRIYIHSFFTGRRIAPVIKRMKNTVKDAVKIRKEVISDRFSAKPS